MLFLILIIIYYFASNLIEYWRLNYNDIIDLKKIVLFGVVENRLMNK